LVWENNLKSSAVPNVSTADELIYTVELRKAFSSGKGIVDSYHFTALDAHLGGIREEKRTGSHHLARHPPDGRQYRRGRRILAGHLGRDRPHRASNTKNFGL
jgi:hypothetical protein